MDLSEFNLFILAFGAMGLGTIMLVRGGDWTIDGAVYIARKFGLSPLIIGFTIVAFGTSLPELIVSINANLKDLCGYCHWQCTGVEYCKYFAGMWIGGDCGNHVGEAA